MRDYYGVLYPQYWTGPTGTALKRSGSKDAVILGAYLASSKDANMIGLYRLTFDTIAHDTILKVRECKPAFAILEREQYAFYDPTSEFVWVREMARIRLQLKRGEFLKAGDNRVEGVNRIYHALPDNAFLDPFFDYYAKRLRLRKRRLNGSTPLRDNEGASVGAREGA